MYWQKYKQHQVVEHAASVKHHFPAKSICNLATWHISINLSLKMCHFTLELWRVPTSALSALFNTGRLTAIVFKDEVRSDCEE